MIDITTFLVDPVAAVYARVRRGIKSKNTEGISARDALTTGLTNSREDESKPRVPILNDI